MRIGGVILLVAATATYGGGPPSEGVRRLAWLQGCWETASGDRTVEEHWMAPRGDSMVGVSRTVRAGKLTDYELVVVREQDGRLVYLAHPSGQPSAEFTATMVSDRRVVFENLQHDFPQRIGYERRGSSLRAWVEGAKNGETPRRIEFPYRLATCSSR